MDIVQILEQKDVKVSAPMVRYSKLAFRTLVRKYGVDLAFTPMIISESFLNSSEARDSDFTTNAGDRPLVVQFAAKNAVELSNATEMIVPFADGVDLNCGCPQRWAMAEGYGACLLRKPELISDMVRQAKNRIPDSRFTLSIKIRIHDNIRKTVDLCRKVESASLSFITVHGRTPKQRCEPANYEAIKTIRESLHIPVIANGDVKSLSDAERVLQETGVNGVMAARGLLQNPALYAGFVTTPLSCVSDWLAISFKLGVTFPVFQHHIHEMTEKVLTKPERHHLNSLQTHIAVLNYFKETYSIS